MRKLISITLILFICIFTPTKIFASDMGNGESQKNQDKSINTVAPMPDIPAKSAVLMDLTTGKLLLEKNKDEQMAPASVTKIMTMLLVMEAIENGKITLDDMVMGTELASSMGGTQIWLEVGEEFSVSDLLKACAVASANDAAVALGEYVGGSFDGFVTMMNDKAQELGMKNTVFKNPTGLDADGHVTTAYDIALMSRELMKYPKIVEYTSIWMDSLRQGQMELVNTNKLVKFYKGCTGLKTGTTDSAGSCLSATATRDGMSIVAVVMGCTTSKDRFNSTRTLLDFGFNNYTMYKTSFSKDILTPLTVKGGVKNEVSLTTDNQGQIIIPKGQDKNIKENVTMQEFAQAPVVKGQELGKITLTLGDEVISEFIVTANEDIEEMTFLNAFIILLKGLIA